MKQLVTYACGHEEMRHIFGSAESIKRQLEHYARYGMCRKCFAEEEREKRRKERGNM